ncbi:MAG: F0F1 ATP synthase subunit C, partial [Deltaproteobacteria bacterium]|nr:F0F1 ATP synthase subunit C [Deltaproteobacteria bacterium]
MAIEGADIIKAAAFIGAGISMGFGAIGPGVGEGM